MNLALQIARALLAPAPLELRALAKDLLSHPSQLSGLSRPDSEDELELAAGAAVIELLCDRSGVEPPQWASSAPATFPPRFVVAAALRMPRLRELCEREAPAALRKHGFLAPPDFLTFA